MLRRRAPIATALALIALLVPALARGDVGDTSTTATATTSSAATPTESVTTTTTTTASSTTSSEASTTSTASSATGTESSATSTSSSSSSTSATKDAHAAGDPGVTISDFKFAPATITIHVGDTITWNNVGPAPHTATAKDHSFDTGTLQKGQSASHTFTKAGTFAYICTIHPFMHGTIVVQAASGGGGGSGSTGTGGSTGSTGSAASSGSTGSTGSTSGSTTTTPASSSGSTLPNTGTDVRLTLLLGGLLIAGGAGLRRRTRGGRG